jgi:glycosyltransferase involved in cell wall biosynthesis
MNNSLDFSIVTPSFNMLQYLPQCCASVADQTGVSLEHVVIDGGSTDGTPAWLRQNQHLRSVSEKDDGMYDAINKGLAISRGKYFAYLNCDEQYLPGTLSTVYAYFERFPQIDVVYGDTLYIRPDYSLLLYRKATKLRWPFILASALYVMTCSTFFRSTIFSTEKAFDKDFRQAGDTELIVRLLRDGYQFAHINRYLASFMITGANAMMTANCLAEHDQLRSAAPAWVSRARLPLNWLRLLEKAVSGAYFQRMPLEYAIYTTGTSPVRTLFRVTAASPVMPRHLSLMGLRSRERTPRAESHFVDK